MELSEFLLARIAEDEHDIGDLANAYPWQPQYGGRRMEWTHDGFVADPRYLLEECGSKRRIVERYGAMAGGMSPESYLAADVLATLAEVYADHADFQSEWR